MNEKQNLVSSIGYVYLQLRGEQSHKLYRLLSYWLSLPKVTLHLHKVEGFWALSRCWTCHIRSPTVAIDCCRLCLWKSPVLHWNEWDCVTLLLRVTCSVNMASVIRKIWWPSRAQHNKITTTQRIGLISFCYGLFPFCCGLFHCVVQMLLYCS